MNYHRDEHVVHWTVQYKLNTRHASFTDFVGEKFRILQNEVITECERIAVRRELSLKMQVMQAQAKNQELQRQIQKMRQSGAREFVQAEGDIGSYASAPEENANEEPTQEPEEGLAIAPTSSKKPFGAEDAIEDGNNLDTCQDLDELCEEKQQPVLLMSDIDDLSAKHATIHYPAMTDGQDDEQEQENLELCLWSEWTQPLNELLKTVSAASAMGMEEYTYTSKSRLHAEWTHRSFIDAPFKMKYACQDACLKTGCTVAPYSLFSLSWDFLGLPILVYDLVTLPLQAFWKHDKKVGAVVEWFITLYWTFDIILRLLVIGYISGKNQVELRRKHIMCHYLKRSFTFDLLLVLPDWISVFFDIPRNLAIFRIIRLTRFMRLMRMSKLQQTARKLQDLVDSEYYQVYLNVFWNVVLIIFCCHYIACFWFWIGNRKIDGYESWVEPYLDDEWGYQYLTSLHWALCQFTPGSMRVQPGNILERIVGILVLIWGLVFFSLFVSSVTQERMRLKGLTKKLDRDNWTLRRYLKQHRVSRGLCVRVGKYVDTFVTPMIMRVQRKDVALLEYLSRPLQLEVQAEIYFHTLLVHPFFCTLREKSGTMASNLFSKVVAEIALARNDLLFEVGQVCHEMFFVSRGDLGYLYGENYELSEVSHVRTSDWCCEQVLFVPWVHRGTIKAAEESYLLSVDSAKFRTDVLEYRERAFVRTCAQAYLEDLQSLGATGVAVDDLIHVASDGTKFMQTCIGDDEEEGLQGETFDALWKRDEQEADLP